METTVICKSDTMKAIILKYSSPKFLETSLSMRPANPGGIGSAFDNNLNRS